MITILVSAAIIILKQTSKVLKKRFDKWKALKVGETQLTKYDVEMEKEKTDCYKTCMNIQVDSYLSDIHE